MYFHHFSEFSPFTKNARRVNERNAFSPLPCGFKVLRYNDDDE